MPFDDCANRLDMDAVGASELVFEGAIPVAPDEFLLLAC
jgi:hypothetical protein